MTYTSSILALGAIGIVAQLISKGESKVETCIHAYLADKYNNARDGSPSKTFLTCMQHNYKSEFETLSKKYNPPPTPESEMA